MEQKKDPVAQWLDAATKAIRFGPDRKAVRGELSAHLEDKALDYQRIFPDLTEEEAQQRAASEMGDPEEIGRELAKLHKPLLGYLWRASQVLVGMGLAGVLITGYVAAAVGSIWDMALREPEEPLQGISFAAQGPVRINHYILWVDHAVLEAGTGELAVSWRMVNPCFWERPNGKLSQAWTAADDQGTVYSSLWTRTYGESRWNSFVGSLQLEDALVGWTGEQSIHEVPWDVQWVQLNLETGGAEPVTLMLEREEGET